MVIATHSQAMNPLPDTSLPEQVILETLDQCVSNTIAPMGIEVNCAELKKVAFDQGVSFDWQWLLREIRAWSPYFTKRPICEIGITSPFAIMDDANVTQWVHALGQQFKLVRGHHVEHAVTLTPREITIEKVALLKGLGFNHLYLQSEATTPIATIERLFDSIRDFRFDFTSLALELPQTLKPFDALVTLLVKVEPDSVDFLSPPRALFSLPTDEVIERLAAVGYYLHNDHVLIRAGSRLHTRPHDVLRLGPAACSCLGGLKWFNIQGIDDYADHVERTCLPTSGFR